MRRLAAAAVLTAIVLVGAGCNTDGTTSASPTASASPTLDVSANTKQVCADVKQLNTDSAAKITAAIAAAVKAGAKGDEAARKKAVDEANTTTMAWVTKLQAEGGKAADPELAKAVNEFATQVNKLVSEDASLDQMKAMVKDGEATLAKHCA